ncbi:hypothetical protein K1T71_011826 [Dendrolimus kikuchii]|uniref:Uncharacterized protein n=1 Tax=Dendrolimus kikuchii TaxID=765133 RepID=A0ACC1CMH2_9NEOP|nr:hypothetical protein K1T71_011826 [Dendrolimus kikuchii]
METLRCPDRNQNEDLDIYYDRCILEGNIKQYTSSCKLTASERIEGQYYWAKSLHRRHYSEGDLRIVKAGLEGTLRAPTQNREFASHRKHLRTRTNAPQEPPIRFAPRIPAILRHPWSKTYQSIPSVQAVTISLKNLQNETTDSISETKMQAPSGKENQAISENLQDVTNSSREKERQTSFKMTFLTF